MKTRKLAAAVAATAALLLGAGHASAQSLSAVISAAQAQFGGEAYDATRVGSLAQIELLSNGRLVEAILEFETGQIVSSEFYGSGRRATQVGTALNRAVLTLPEAIQAGLQAVGPGDVVDAELRVTGNQSGRQFVVDIRTASGLFDVTIDAADGRIIRIVRD